MKPIRLSGALLTASEKQSKEETAVSKETAQTTALNHAGLTEGSVTLPNLKLN